MRTRLFSASVALVVAIVAITVGLSSKHDANEQALAATDALYATTTTTESTTTTSTTEPPATTTLATAPPATVLKAAATATTARRTTATTRVVATTTPVAHTDPLATDAPLVAGNPAAFRGLGAWIDVYDWSNEYTKNNPSVRPSDVDRMAERGAQALYVQAAKANSTNDVVDIDLLRPIINRAHQRGMTVIAWYLPTLEDPARDLRRLTTIAGLNNVDAIAVDIESRAVSDVAERNRRLVDLSTALRQRLPGTPIAATVMPAALMEVVNPNFWPGFPYRDIAPAYDVWQPMDYWTSRKPESGYRDAYRYTAENIDRLRAQLGRPDLPVHPVGGIADTSTTDDIDGFHRAAAERGAIGGSVYDYHTTGDDLWPHLASFRS